jgi:hypothetical protein
VTRVNRALVAAAAAIGMSTGAVALIPTVMNASTTVSPVMSGTDVANLYNAAQLQFRRGEVPLGLNALRKVLAADPSDTDVLALQAIWSNYSGDLRLTQTALTALGTYDGPLQVRVREALSGIDRGVVIGPNPVPGLHAKSTGIVVLGAGLNADGTPTDETASRLFAVWTQAIVAFESPVIISGGAAVGAHRDADVMRTWLVDHGIAATRIHVDSTAHSVAQSAVGIAGIVAKLGLADVVVVTSPDQVRRVAADLVVAGVPVVSATTSTRELFGNLAVPAKVDQRAIYVDVTDILGLPSDRMQPPVLTAA